MKIEEEEEEEEEEEAFLSFSHSSFLACLALLAVSLPCLAGRVLAQVAFAALHNFQGLFLSVSRLVLLGAKSRSESDS